MKKYAIILLLVITASSASGQNKPAFGGIQFWAMTVTDVAATSKWYEDVFQMKLLKEITFEKGKVRIIGNENLTLEILQIAESKSLSDCSLDVETSHLLKGIFKTGFYVNDIVAAEKYFRSKGVSVRHDVFEDKDMKAKSFIMVDLNQNMIQVLQTIP